MKRLLAFACAVFCIAGSAFAADVFTFSADRMSGGRSRGRETSVLSGNARVTSDNLQLSADRIEISGANNRYVDCAGNVVGVDEVKGIRFTTERLRYDRETGIARLEGSSSLEDKKNKVVAKGRFIEYNQDEGIALLQVGVRIFKDEMVCRSQYALYKREEKTLELAGMPVVVRDGDRFASDRMFVNLDTNDIRMEGDVSGSIRSEGKPQSSPAPETTPAPDKTPPPEEQP